ncbi:hypothetical protein BKH41_01480 [Helicobacter sp. 12S02232-10]|uniref:hypothetical protein n=1 Tax=Helicobacter sp. 12S02232-10 TaxID=1476197 RepID=UPI000BA59D5A|nr:hypothetical protein [Helicobacter sp. 12S02232-10]PAF49995.1 hypothetical protein BKH41_01480 [Helicobacter sp. 12S02232-10]
MIKILEFFTGVFFGIAIFGGISCFLILRDFDSWVSFLLSITFFGIFSFFGILSKSLSILLKHNDSNPV